MILKTRLFGHVYEFKSVREVMAKANEEKSGDKLAGIAAETAEERVAAKVVLSNLTVNDVRNSPAVPYEEDEVTRIIQDDVNETIYNTFKNWTMAELREWILDERTTGDMIKRLSRGLTSEVVAGVCKLMSNLDLIYAAKKIRVSAHCNTTIGLPGTFSSRLQPNHTTDDPTGIIASVMEGLSLGCGDAVIGLNPVDDSVESVARILKMFDEFKNKWEIPTQICVLAHVTTQTAAAQKFGAPMDLMFQSIAGSQKGNEAFGLTADMLTEGRATMLSRGTSTGPNVMYFETGQGSELSSDAHNGWDQVTMEARCYGFAKRFQPFLVNTVVGFMDSKTFDNGTICASEQSIICDEDMVDAVRQEMEAQGAYFLDEAERAQLGRFILRANGTMNPQIVGRSVKVIADLAGLDRVPATARVLVAKEDGVGRGHPYSNEKLAPILGFYTGKDYKDVCSKVCEILHYEGAGHTFSMHTKDDAMVDYFAKRVPASRIMVNTPSALGGIGGTTSLQPALTLGCGAIGGSATSENVGPMHLMNKRYVAFGMKELDDIKATIPSCKDGICNVAPDLSSVDVDAIVQSVISKLKAL